MMSRKTKECGGRKGSNLKSWKTETGGSLFGNLRIAYLGEFLSISPRDVKKHIWVPLSLLKERKNSLSVGVSYPGLTRLSTPHVTGCPRLGGGRQSEKNKGSRTTVPSTADASRSLFSHKPWDSRGYTGAPQTWASKGSQPFESPQGDDGLQPLIVNVDTTCSQ